MWYRIEHTPSKNTRDILYYPHPSSSPPKQTHPQSFEFLGLDRLQSPGKYPCLLTFVGFFSFKVVLSQALLSVIGSLTYEEGFASTNSDQSLCFPQYYCTISLLMLCSPSSFLYNFPHWTGCVKYQCRSY